jgi:hypothetical protein
LTRVDYTEDVLVFWSYSPEINAFRRHLRGGLAPLRLAPTKAILRGLLACDLTPTSAVQDRVDRFRGEHLRPGTVGVHVRYTDLRVSLDRILAEVDRLVSRRVTPPIFLATDNAEITSLFASRYRDVVSTPHWFPAGDAARLHGHPECPDLLENAIEALTDLYLLAACDRLIVDSSSTFARVAGLLADGPVTDVRPVVPRVLHALSRHSRSAARVLTIRVARNRAAP